MIASSHGSEGMRMDRVGRTAVGVLLIADILVIALDVFVGWDVFNLDQEMNLPTWYSSVKLLTLAVMSALIWNVERRARHKFRFIWLWLVVALIFLGASADETACFHERMGRYIMLESPWGLDIRETVLGGDQHKDSFAWVLLLSPLILTVALFFLIFFVNRFRHSRPAVLAAMSGLGFFFLAIGLEASVYLQPHIRDWSEAHVRLYQALTTIEEAAELLGSTFFVIAFFFYRRQAEALQMRSPEG